MLRSVGDAEAALTKAARVIEAEYHVPHLAHAPMEPPVAVARVEADSCEVWAPTQHPQAARGAGGQDAAACPGEASQVHVTFLGGGFGRKSKADFISEVALLAKEAGVPVRVQWTREDDVRNDYYHSVERAAPDRGPGRERQGGGLATPHRLPTDRLDLRARQPALR